MRISDWSSDVCSSDLPVGGVLELAPSANVPPPSMPALPSTGSGRGQADEIDYRIAGGDMQFVEIELDPGESAISEAGALMYKDSPVQIDTVFGDCSHAGQDGGMFDKLLAARKRVVTGASLFTTMFTHVGQAKTKARQNGVWGWSVTKGDD